MREEENNWFTRWEEELPSPEELTPLSQTLISPDLALAFNISPHAPPPLHHSLPGHHNHPAPPSPSEFDSPELSSGGGGNAAGDEPARTLKRPRLVWTPQLHKRFVDAVAHLGIKNAVPKTIMQLMSVDGLTRENVASHLQKYRLYLKRMQGISGGGGGGGSASGAVSDPATDHLFASGPVPAHFLHPAAFIPTVSNHHHHSHGVVARPVHQPYGHFGNSPPNGGGFEHNSAFLRQQRMGMPLGNGGGGGGGYGEDINSRNAPKVLTLFPTGDD